MSEANVIFTLDGVNVTVQCSPEDKMRDICQKYGTKIKINPSSLIFLYGGNQLNMDLRFKEQANLMDKTNKEMKVLVYKIEHYGLICPKCGEKIEINKENIDNIISSNNNIRDNIIGIKSQIENIINTNNTSINLINIHLKNINIILNTINEDIIKNNEKLNNLLNDYINNKSKNIIKGILDIKSNQINNNILLFNTDINEGIDVYLNNEKIEMIKEDKKWIINYKFKKAKKYLFEIHFNNIINNMERFFQECHNIILLDYSNFDT